MSDASNGGVVPGTPSGQVPTTLVGNLFVEPDLSCLDMGIWSDDGTVWLPKRLYPERSLAKRFAVEFMDAFWIDVRVRTRWMRKDHMPEIEDMPYVVCDPTDEGAFECWEIT